jgi:WD40-like Beta Propeller Repeat
MKSIEHRVSALVSFERFVAAFILTFISASTSGEDNLYNPPIRNLIAWEKADTPQESIIQILKSVVNSVNDMVVRVTSPDVAPEKRHLWIISADGKEKRLLSRDVGVRNPRWGAAGYIVYEVETETNNDGVIAANDELVLHVIPANGGRSRELGTGRSPVWSPDGTEVAFLRDDGIWIYNLAGKITKLGSDQRGRIIFTDRRSAATATNFWILDISNQVSKPLPADLKNRYLWLRSVSPSGSKLVFDEMPSNIFVRSLVDGAEINLTPDTYSNCDPAWSPDEKYIVFVSDRPTDGED